MKQGADDDRGRRHETYLDALRLPSLAAARRVLPIVFELVEVASVVDIGCGPGAWLAAAREVGIRRLVGVDGPWAGDWLEGSLLGTGDFKFVSHDLEEPLPALGHFDLALALGVAEYLPEVCATALIPGICEIAPAAILFSSAIPFQPKNAELQQTEKWPSWWAHHFEECGYRPLDAIRPLIWSDPTIAWWYRQGIILYTKESKHQELAARARLVSPTLDVVHPELFTGIASWSLEPSYPRREPGLRERLRIARGIPRALGRSLRRRIHKWKASR